MAEIDEFKNLPDAMEEFKSMPNAEQSIGEKIGTALSTANQGIAAGLQGLGQGLSLGTADEIRAGLVTPVAMLEKVTGDIKGEYGKALEYQRYLDEFYKKNYGIPYSVGEAVGTVAPALMTGGATLLAKGAPAALKAAQPAIKAISPVAKGIAQPAKELIKKVLFGAGQGAVSGAGYSQAKTPEELAAATATGGLVGGALPIAGKIVGGLKKASGEIGKNLASVFSGVKKEAIERMAARPDDVLRAGKLEINDLAEDLYNKIKDVKATTSNITALKTLKNKFTSALPIEKEIKKKEKELLSLKVFASDPENKAVFDEFKRIKNLVNVAKDKKGNIDLNELRAIYDAMDKNVDSNNPLYGINKKINNIFSDIRYGTIQNILKKEAPIYGSEMERISQTIKDLGFGEGKKTMTPDQLVPIVKRLGMGKEKIADKTIKNLEKYGLADEIQTIMDKAAAEEFEKTGLKTGFVPGLGIAAGGLIGGGSGIAEGKDVGEIFKRALIGGSIGGTTLSSRQLLGGLAAKTAADLTRKTSRGLAGTKLISTAAKRAALSQVGKMMEKKPMSEFPE